MKKILFFFFLLFSLTSCDPVKKEEVKVVVEDFFTAYRMDDLERMKSLYPNITKLEGGFRKSTSIDVDLDNIIVLNDTNIIVNIKHHWINPLGADLASDMKFYLKKQEKKSTNKYIIKDSKNFVLFDEDKKYSFAKNKGIIDSKTDTTDFKISSKILKVEPVFYKKKMEIEEAIENGMKVSNFNWETNYRYNYASGRAMLTNTSPYGVKMPKYIVEYRNTKNGPVIEKEEGYVTYGVLRPGESKSFSWYTPYAGNANWAHIEIKSNMDNDWIEEIVALTPILGR